MGNHHDTGYKELFSYPEFVRQLIEGFTSPEIARIMDFSTLKLHSGHYITPLFEEKVEDLVWSVEVQWGGNRRRVYLYLLLEFQSTVDPAMPLRMTHYVVCFYQHLLKTKAASLRKGLPPIFPVVLYNGSKKWTAATDIYDLITPQPPVFMQPYQPRLRYYLIDESQYDREELEKRHTPLSAVFEIEVASKNHQNLHKAIERIVAIIRAAPNRKRIDKLITRWLKRHLHHLGVDINLDKVNSLLEDKDMLAENLENMIKRERSKGHRKGVKETLQKTLRKLIQLKFGDLPEWAEAQLEKADAQKLEAWTEGILLANSLEELLGQQ